MAEQVEEAAPFGNVKLKVMAYTIPMMGHALPLVSLCKALAQRGHQVTLAASSGLPQLQESCTTAGLKHAPLDDGFTPELLKAQDPMGPVFWDFMNADQKLFSSLLENESPDVVVSDYVSAAPFEICRTKKIPLVLNIPLPGTLVRRMQILTYPFVGKILRPAMPATMKNALIFLTQHVLPVAGRTLSIINSCAAMDGDLQLPPNYFFSGPLDGFEKKDLHPEKHADLLDFLSRARAANMPVAYITTGSLTLLSEQQVLALYEGFAACNIWVVWSLKKDRQEFLPKDLPERFYVNSWIPQAELMQRPELLCVLTHCGWGGTLECMLAAKPVICYAGFGDQMENAKLLNSRGCGPMLSKPTESSAKEIQEAVENVLQHRDSYSAKAAEISENLRASPGPLVVAEEIESLVKNGSESVPKPYHLHGPGCQIS